MCSMIQQSSLSEELLVAKRGDVDRQMSCRLNQCRACFECPCPEQSQRIEGLVPVYHNLLNIRDNDTWYTIHVFAGISPHHAEIPVFGGKIVRTNVLYKDS